MYTSNHYHHVFAIQLRSNVCVAVAVAVALAHAASLFSNFFFPDDFTHTGEKKIYNPFTEC